MQYIKLNIEQKENIDAFGNPIIIGNKYAYTKSEKGSNSTIIGIAEKNIETRTTIIIKNINLFLCGENSPEEITDGRKTSVRSIKLFPC